MQAKHSFIDYGQKLIQTEGEAVMELAKRLDQDFERACELILNCQGHVIVLGMGKSGHVGRKIAATLASTGSPAFFVHPGEASHGDLGMITPRDLLIAISYSGETAEIISLLAPIQAMGVSLISLSRANSTLAQASLVNLDISFAPEACPLDLAPTTSTTLSLVLGDALAISVSSRRGLTKENFSVFHPGGLLGKRLLLQVKDIMHQGTQLPKVSVDTSLDQALVEITSKRLGMTTVVDQSGVLQGIFTDGDLRRSFQKKIDIHQVLIKDLMTTHSKTIEANVLAAFALELMEEHKITVLVVVDFEQKPIGIIHLHDLVQLGLSQ